MPFIKIRNLKKSYELEDQQIRALVNVDVTIEKGEFVVILGQSGCGKSTLLNILGGMDKPTSGEVIVGGQNLAKMKTDELARYRREMVGMIFQKFNLIPDMTILENVKLPLKFSGLNDRKQTAIAAKVLEDVGLGERLKSTPNKLSGGQQQRVAIARSLVNNPQILLCDEPTGNLDSKTGLEIIDLLHKLNDKGITIIMVTHNDQYAKKANRVIKMLDSDVLEDNVLTRAGRAADRGKVTTKTIGLRSRLRLAWKNLGRRKLRFFLTSFGVAIGAMAIVILVSFGAGLQHDVEKQLAENAQVEEINVTGAKQNFNFQMGPSFEKQESKPLNNKTITDLKAIPDVKAVYPSINLMGEVTVNDKVGNLYANSITPVEFITDSLKQKAKYGRFLEKDDEKSLVIPYGLATALGYENVNDILGKEVTLKKLGEDKDGSHEFKVNVVGVMDKDEKFSFAAYIPYQTAEEFLKTMQAEELKKDNPELYTGLTARAVDSSKVEAVRKAIDDKGYGTSSYADIAKSMNRVFVIMQIVLGVVGGIALLVASLGIVNTMLMSVLERTKEIGVMKAVGARARDIRSIFLSEASFIGLFGGVVGLLLGYSGTNLISAIVNAYMKSKGTDGQELTFFIPLYLSLGVVAFSVLVSSLAGYLPARRAAQLDPAIALRDE